MGLGGLMKLSMTISAIDGLTGPVGKMVRSMGNLEAVARRGQAMVDMGNNVGAAGRTVSDSAATMRSHIGALLAPVMEVEDSLAELQTVWTPAAGTVSESMERAKAAAVDWSNTHKASASEFIRTAYQMGSAGLKENQALAGTKAALTLATSSLGDNVEAANLLAGVYNTLGDKNVKVEDEMGRMADVLARTQQLFQIANLGQLNAGLQYAIPVTQQARVSFEQMNAAIGQLNSSGLQGSMAGTAYSSMLTRMATASEDLGFSLVKTADGGLDLERTLESIRNTYGPLSRQTSEVQEKFKKAFGDDGVRAIGLLTENLAGFQAGVKELESAEGAAAKGAAAIESTSSAGWKRMKNQLQNITMEVGEQLLPILQELTPVISEVVAGVRDWVAEHPGLTRLGVLSLAIGTGVGSILGPLIRVSGGFIKFGGYGMRAFAWVGQRGGVLQKIIFGIGAPVRWVGGLLMGLGQLGGGALMVLGRGAASAASGFIGLAGAALRAGLAFMATPMGWIIAAVGALAGLVVWAIADWEGFKQFWVDLWDSVVGVLEDAWDWIKGTVDDIGDAINGVTNLLPGGGLGGPADEGARQMAGDYFARLRGEPAAAAPTPVRSERADRFRSEGPALLPSHTPASVVPTVGGFDMPELGALKVPVELDTSALSGLDLGAVNLPVGFDFPELARGEARTRDEVAQRPEQDLVHIPDRRPERPVEQGPKTVIQNLSLSIQSGEKLDERRLVDMVVERLNGTLRAQRATP